MASISRTSSSSANSIYGTRNVISGLASGMDTESMIENAISGYKSKISSLNQQRTKLGWQQEAYRDIITKMAGFSSKYTSYTSGTNLMSSSFFNQAVQTVANGANASKVAASGRGTSDVVINGVRQLATAATYKLSGSALMGNKDESKYASASASKGFDLDKMTVSSFSGTMNLTYGKDQNLSFTFSEGDVFNSVKDLAENMQKQLESQTISLSNGGGKKASDMLTVEFDEVSNTISFKDKANNKVYISSVSESMEKAFGVNTGEGNKSFRVGSLTKEVDSVGYLSKSPLSITLDGVTKTIKMPTMDDIVENLDKDYEWYDALKTKLEKGEEITSPESRQKRDEAYVKALQASIDKAFGTMTDKDGNQVSKLKVSDGLADSKDASGLQLKFEAGQPGSSFSVTSSVGKSMGFGGTQLTSYLNTNKTLKDLLGEEGLKGLETGKDKNGNTTYALEINGVKIGDFTEKTELGTILSRINSNKDAGVNVSYSKLTNEFTFTARETGTAGKIDFSAEGYGAKDGQTKTLGGMLFGTFNAKDGTGGPQLTTEGRDAIFTATIDGKEMELTRASNTVDMDGMSITLKGTFGYKENDKGQMELDRTSEPVTFTTSSDVDTIKDAIKSFVNDYNEMVKEIHDAYSTMPNEKSSKDHSRYLPLTEEDKKDMSESAIKAYEEKAKQGLLFGSSDLSNLYRQLTNTIQMSGADANSLSKIGIKTSYSDGLTTLELDENVLTDALKNNPDSVRDAFSRSVSNGASSDGLMYNLKSVLDTYANTSTGSMGLLIQQAGSSYAPNSVNSNNLQKEYDNFTAQIEKWQDKMSDKVDYYTRQFTALEQLIAQMNNQSSMLSGLQGGY